MLPPCYPDQATQMYDSATDQCIPIPNGFEPYPTELVYSSISGRCEPPAPSSSVGTQLVRTQNMLDGNDLGTNTEGIVDEGNSNINTEGKVD